MRSRGRLTLCLTSSHLVQYPASGKSPHLELQKNEKLLTEPIIMWQDSWLTCLNNILTDGCWSQRERRARFKVQELLAPTERRCSTVCFFFFFNHFQILMSSYNEALQQMTAAPTGKSRECQQPESLGGLSLFSAFSHIGLAHKSAHSKLQAWSCQHIKLEC